MLIDELGRSFRLSCYGLALRNQAVLLVRVSADQEDAGFWTLPGGGIEWGEGLVPALIREFEEETGIIPEVGPILGAHSFVVTSEQRNRRGPDIEVVQLVYAATASGELRNETEGSTDLAKWWGIDELDEVTVTTIVDLALSWTSSEQAPRPRSD